MNRFAVIGAGSWGSAMAYYLGRLGFPTRLWVREEDVLANLFQTRINHTFLPGFEFPVTVTFHKTIAEAVEGSEVIFVAVPSQFCRQIYQRMDECLKKGQLIVSLTKGLEQKTFKTMTEVMEEIFDSSRKLKLAVLSGPSFAREVAAGHPTALVLASRDQAQARELQETISSRQLRIYTSTDVIGVELGGAVKNVIAIAAGISVGLGYGNNSRATLITRGLVELTRLGQALGARKETFYGLAGLGDLVLTCTSEMSRNYRVGLELSRGKSLKLILSEMKMVAEGVRNTLTVHKLANHKKIEMPICQQIYEVLYRGKPAHKALEDLMSRSLKEEKV
ncbi:MAG: NAD(P)H-dependent glycerol-3-phosphate dehydrogenase [Candidatus Saccharicenans sp.]|nr:NAD(P)H-dependent glycerol-3-phosphate dehydrogenase [Candidatus Saccharicenans sp.]MDI6848569.1 NAD(P)H-dependent glycerol-3-phosphate dehydrogenase [Candidatus Saccharicenans sp.]